MNEIGVGTEVALQSLIGDMREAFRAHKFLRVSWKAGKTRTIDQNSISHAWYSQMAREDRQHDTLGHRCYCKLHHGVPILRAEEEDFRATYDAVIRPLPYELKLEAMKHWPVTSLMTKEQLSKYLEAVQRDYATRGVYVQFPAEAA